MKLFWISAEILNLKKRSNVQDLFSEQLQQKTLFSKNTST